MSGYNIASTLLQILLEILQLFSAEKDKKNSPQIINIIYVNKSINPKKGSKKTKKKDKNIYLKLTRKEILSLIRLGKKELDDKGKLMKKMSKKQEKEKKIKKTSSKRTNI